ncbi:hypothetical protein C9J01_27540 [Photobacterium rosenbergii]|uniref:Uncharacterized protein n=2 Tax=Photobacterium rosenbergii TaxID=294936 RepID=A0A2T3MZK5_9GAMM|nr:hypothetical protein C9J01_27540 [Photobacterium rosenbergii]
MYSTSGKPVSFKGPNCSKALDRHVSYKGELMCLYRDNLSFYSGRSNWKVDLPATPIMGTGVINNNLAGSTSVAFIGADDYKLYTSNTYDKWHEAETTLHRRSDFSGILDTHPINRNYTAVGVYEYVNVFNKGVDVYYFGPDGLISNGTLANSPEFNYGFETNVFGQGNDVFITAQNSSERELQTYKLSRRELTGLEKEDNPYSRYALVDLMFGYGIAQTSWEVNQKISIDSKTRARASFDMNDSLLHNYYAQGRVGNTQATVHYLTSEAKNSDSDLVSKGTEALNAVVDFNGMFGGATTLRLELEKMASGGVVTYSDDMTEIPVQEAFETEYNSLALYLMLEQGLYFGLHSSNYLAPSAVGFETKSGSYAGSAFDRDFDIDRYLLVVGYDEASYGSRYETSYNRFYINGEVGVGLNKLNVSRGAFEEAVGREEGKIQGKYALALTSTLELGYTLQHRSTTLRGLGYSLQAGYRARGDWTFQSKPSSSDKDGYYLVYDRADLWHGPFIQFNAIF